VSAFGNAPAPPPVNNAPPSFPGQKPAGETKSEKFKLNVAIKHADLKGEGDGVQARLILPAKIRDLPPPAGAPAKVGSNEQSPRSLVAAIALSLAAVSVVFVVRGKRLNAASKAAIFGIAVVVAGYAVAQANIAPPPRPLNYNVAPLAPVAKSQIIVEFSADATEAVLILPEK
jgi:hypothetical protein